MHSGDTSDKDNAPSSWREVLFADLLQSVRVRSATYFRPELGAPWGFRLAVRSTAFHIVAQGSCWLEVKGFTKPVELTDGDFVVMPRGDAHVLFDSLASPIVDFSDMIKRNPPDNRGIFRAGGNGTVTKFVSSSIQLENAAIEPLLAVLPPLIHVRGRSGPGSACIHATVTQILEELDTYRAGTQTVVTRLADILLIQAVRTYFDQNLATAEHGWLGAIRDPHIGAALALLHANPLEPWTVASLARRVAASRSLFAEKFAQLVGEPPLHYLKRLRLNAATLRLRSTNDKLAAIAADAGYESAGAFTKAFKKHLGKTPGEYRRSR